MGDESHVIECTPADSEAGKEKARKLTSAPAEKPPLRRRKNSCMAGPLVDEETPVYEVGLTIS